MNIPGNRKMTFDPYLIKQTTLNSEKIILVLKLVNILKNLYSPDDNFNFITRQIFFPKLVV